MGEHTCGRDFTSFIEQVGPILDIHPSQLMSTTVGQMAYLWGVLDESCIECIRSRARAENVARLELIEDWCDDTLSFIPARVHRRMEWKKRAALSSGKKRRTMR